MYSPHSAPRFETGPLASGATPWTAPGRRVIRLSRPIREREAARSRRRAGVRAALRGALLLAWALLALGAWLLLVRALPAAVLSAR